MSCCGDSVSAPWLGRRTSESVDGWIIVGGENHKLARETLTTETFGGDASDWKNDPNNHDGTLDVASTDDIGSGVAPPYLRIRADLSRPNKNNMSEAVMRTILGRPSRVRIARVFAPR